MSDNTARARVPLKRYWRLLANYLRPERQGVILLAVLLFSRTGLRLAGRTENARYDVGQQAVVGDIKLLTGTPPGDQARAIFADPVVRETAGLSIYWPYQVDADFLPVEGRTVTVPRKLLGNDTAKLSLDFVTLPTAGGRVGRAA